VHMANHDGLTGLANRTRFVGRVDRALADPTTTSALLFIDLDHFKIVNDHLGHAYGDIVLQAVCKRIEAAIRPTDLAGRLGGDEIAVFCPKVASARLVSVRAALRRASLLLRTSPDVDIVTSTRQREELACPAAQRLRRTLGRRVRMCGLHLR